MAHLAMAYHPVCVWDSERPVCVICVESWQHPRWFDQQAVPCDVCGRHAITWQPRLEAVPDFPTIIGGNLRWNEPATGNRWPSDPSTPGTS